MSIATCPKRGEWIDYLAGKLSEETSDSLADHLESCPDCQADIAALPDTDDTLVALLRGDATPDPYLDESQCINAVALAKALGEGPFSVGAAAKLPPQRDRDFTRSG